MAIEIDGEIARSRLHYNQETGDLTWKPRVVNVPTDKTWNKKWAGKKAGTINNTGTKLYIRTALNNKRLYAHRIIFAMMFDSNPEEIDHINGNGLDNRLCNLRAADRAENSKNIRIRDDNSSGTTGVSWDKSRSKWAVQVCHKKFGRFSSKEEAIKKCKVEHEKVEFHKNHGSIRPL